MDLSNTIRREQVDGHEWARRYLSIALAAENIDEKDFHVSLALQLLTETEAPNAARQGGKTGTPSDD